MSEATRTPRSETETSTGLPTTDGYRHGKTGRISTGPFTLPCDIPVRTHAFFENVSLCFLCVYSNWIKDLKLVLEVIVNCLKICSII